MVALPEITGTDLQYLLALLVLLFALALGLLIRRAVRRFLVGAGVPEQVEGTSFDRWTRRIGSSTVGVFSELAAWFVYGLGVLFALRLADILPAATLWLRLTNFLPSLFWAIFILGLGFLLGDKAELYTAERLSGVKLPEITVLPAVVKWSIFYVAVVLALSQVGAATGPLVVLLAMYALGILLVLGLATRDLLPAVAAGVYVLLHQPYTIGDTIVVDGREGVVQEIDIYTTTVEADDTEHVVPNHQILRDGVSRRLD